MTLRRSLMGAAALLPMAASAQQPRYPSRPIRIIVALGAGGDGHHPAPRVAAA